LAAVLAYSSGISIHPLYLGAVDVDGNDANQNYGTNFVMLLIAVNICIKINFFILFFLKFYL